MIDSECSVGYKRKVISERYYEKYYWLYYEKVIAKVDVYSLLCVFRYNIDEHLWVIEIEDILRTEEINHYYEFLFIDWKSIHKIINYKEHYQILTN